ncbi:MAG: hypothetical protein QNJ51_22885 [Calothrix sp. MO_167.B12]|nr:hypothetical protein [Calothrix sp. MO_167.B12]
MSKVCYSGIIFGLDAIAYLKGKLSFVSERNKTPRFQILIPLQRAGKPRPYS